MTRTALTRSLLYLFLTTFGTGAPADVLLIEQVRQAGKMDVPVNGLSMADVEARYGAPVEKHAAVGDPPIARWVYERWSVYFEYDRALYTVLHEGEVIEGVSQPEPATESQSETNGDGDSG